MGIEFSDEPSSGIVGVILVIVFAGVVLNGVFKAIEAWFQRRGLTKAQKRVLLALYNVDWQRPTELLTAREFDMRHVQELIDLGFVETQWGEPVGEFSKLSLSPKGQLATYGRLK